MEREKIIAAIRSHEAELRAAGVASLSVFGSVARGEDNSDSDLDVALMLSPGRRGLAYFSQMNFVKQKLEDIVGRKVDIVSEPVRHERLRQNIQRDRAIAF